MMLPGWSTVAPISAKKLSPMALVKLPGFSGLRSGATPNPIIPSTNKTILAIPSMVVTAINEPIRANKIPATAATIMIIHAQAGIFFQKLFTLFTET